MIAFRDNLPLVELESGQTVAFEREWLLRSLAAAARKAGYQEWWLAPHVAESVTQYLQAQTETNVLTCGRLEKAVQSVLQVIGYSEVGRHFSVGKPIAQISLLALAHAAGNGYELAFFEKLGRLIRELVLEKRAHFELFGLEACVKLLRARKVWSRDCDALREEIVSFTREQTGIAAAEGEVSFSLA